MYNQEKIEQGFSGPKKNKKLLICMLFLLNYIHTFHHDHDIHHFIFTGIPTVSNVCVCICVHMYMLELWGMFFC